MGRSSKLKVGDTCNGILTVVDIEPQGKAGLHTKYKVHCSLCNSISTKTLPTINKSVSCGCERNNSSLWKQIGAKNRTWQLDEGEAAFNGLYTSYKNRATKSNKEFSLTKELFRELTKGACYYCGEQPNQIIKGLGKTSGNYVYNGIDRVDSSKGYLKDNVVSCCKTCNFMKLDHSKTDFLKHIEKIYKYKYAS